MKPLISLHDVYYRYSGQNILSGLDFEVLPGESVVITGASGVGKSTLVRLAAGLLRPCSGSAVINTQKIGFVFQEPRLLPWRTALENVMLPLEMSGSEAVKTARNLLALMGLVTAESQYPNQLSGGMRQRVSLARALAVSPDVLMLDEPFTGLDVELRDGMKTLLESAVCGRGIGIIQVTHHVEDILKGTQHIYRLENGKLRLPA